MFTLFIMALSFSSTGSMEFEIVEEIQVATYEECRSTWLDYKASSDLNITYDCVEETQ